MHTYYTLEMDSDNMFQLAEPMKDKADALEVIHKLNRMFPYCRFTLVRPSEQELVGEQR